MTRRANPAETSSASTTSLPSIEPLDDLLKKIIDAVMRDPAAVPGLVEMAVEEAEGRRDDRSIARAAIAQAWLAIVRFQLRDAMDASEKALALFVRTGDLQGEAEALNIIGRLHTSTGDHAAALENATRALEIARASNDLPQQCDALIGRGVALQASGRYAEALEPLAEAGGIARTLGDSDRSGSIALVTGSVLRLLGRNHQALEEFRGALGLAVATGNRRFESHALGNIGAMLERLGDFTGALEHHHKALHLNEQLGDRRGTAINNNNIALILQRLGQFPSALEHFLASLATSSASGDHEGELTTLANIGGLYEVVGAHGPVLEYYQRSRLLAEQIGSPQGEANALLLIGRYHLHAGDRQNALLHLFRALRMHERTGDRYGHAAALFTIGIALRRMGDLERARTYLEQAIEESAEAGDRVAEMNARIELASLDLDEGNAGAAIAALENVLEVSQTIDARETSRRTLEGLAAALRAEGRPAEGAARAEEARRILLSMFDSESSHRLSALMTGFERTTAEQHGAEMGVAREDLDEIASVLSRGLPAIEAPAVEQPPLAPDHEEPAASTIRVVTFGRLQVFVGAREISPADWKRKRSRDLFKLLLLNYRRALPLDSIVEHLGGEIGSRGAELVVMNAVSHIRRALEPERAPRDRTTYLRHSDGAYLLDLGDDAEIDFIRFKELVAAARRERRVEERYRFYEQAAALYHDDFLNEDYDAPWTDQERSTLRDARLEAMEYIAAGQLANGGIEEAIATARTILEEDVASLPASETLLQALLQRGRLTEAQAAAAGMEKIFIEQIGGLPAPLRTLMDRIAAADPAGVQSAFNRSA